MSISQILSAGLERSKVSKMKIKGKLIASFSLIIVLNLILAAVLYFSFNTVKNNVKAIEEKFTPTANSISDLRNNLAWIYAARGELLEGAFLYQSALLDGDTVTEAEAAADPYYESANETLIDKSANVISIYGQFSNLGYFSTEQLDEIKANILLTSRVYEKFLGLKRYYEGANWASAETTLEELDIAALAANAGLSEVEALVDDQVAVMNQETTQKASLAVWLIIGLNCGALVIGLALAFGLASLIATPLRKLTRAANNIGEGEVDTDIPTIKTKDEVHDLADALETMRGAIRFLKQNG